MPKISLKISKKQNLFLILGSDGFIYGEHISRQILMKQLEELTGVGDAEKVLHRRRKNE